MPEPGWKHDPETRERIAEAQRAHWRDPAYREKVSARIKARWADPEFRARRLPPEEPLPRPSRAERKRERLEEVEDRFERWISRVRPPDATNSKVWRPRGRDPWTPAEDRYVLEHLGRPVREVARVLGRSMRAVYNRRWALSPPRPRPAVRG
jgi:hypothetical protein